VTTSSALSLVQDGPELDDVHGRLDHWWYLRSPEFTEAFTVPLAAVVNSLGESCLDACCGEGYLADYVRVPYLGFDGSAVAIERAKRDRPAARALFRVGRLEDPPDLAGVRFGTVVFGSVLEVLVRPEARAGLLRRYARQYRSSFLVVYDLERLDTGPLEAEFRLLQEHHWAARAPRRRLRGGAVETVPEVKLRRKCLVFRVPAAGRPRGGGE